MKKISILITSLILFAWNLHSGPLNHASEWQDFLKHEGKDWSAHFNDAGALKSLYRRGENVARANETSAGVLQQYGSLFGVTTAADLRVIKSDESEIGTHTYYQQYYSGFPVVGAEVQIHLDRRHRLLGATSSFKPVLHVDSVAAIAASQQAAATASQFFQGKAITSAGRLMILPLGRNGRLVWEIAVDSSEISGGSWIFYVDAADPRLVLRARKTYATFEGRGNIWLENPVVTPNRVIQTFTNMDATKALSGKFAKTLNGNFEHSVFGAIDTTQFTTAKETNRRYDYSSTYQSCA
jgi:Zn-dependent metalloprotease